MITLEEIKNLQSLAGRSLSDCKKALEESEGDLCKAINILLKKGVPAIGLIPVSDEEGKFKESYPDLSEILKRIEEKIKGY